MDKRGRAQRQTDARTELRDDGRQRLQRLEVAVLPHRDRRGRRRVDGGASICGAAARWVYVLYRWLSGRCEQRRRAVAPSTHAPAPVACDAAEAGADEAKDEKKEAAFFPAACPLRARASSSRLRVSVCRSAIARVRPSQKLCVSGQNRRAVN